jgi:trehalose-6-phosphate synthase
MMLCDIAMCEMYYSGFANGLLWPLFHYMQPAIELIQAAGEQFTAYQQANQAFCDIVMQHYQEGDLIWVHDYHLFLLPALLRAAIPSAKVPFHICGSTYDSLKLLY